MSSESLNILLVEDNHLNQKLIRLTLGRYGFNIDVADNGYIAIEKVNLNHYHLILMDLMMPGMDGLTTTKMIREIENPSVANIPIVGLTANTLDSDREKCLASGMDEYLVKPFNVDDFFDVLKILDLVKE